MTVLVYLIFFLFSLGSIGRLSFVGQQINIYLYEILLGIYLLLLIWKYKWTPLKEAYKKYKSAFIFLAVLLLSYLVSLMSFSLSQNLISLLYFARLTFYFLAFFYFAWLVVDIPNVGKKLSSGLIFFSLLTLIFSGIQYFLYPDLRNLFYLGWDPHLYRVFGLYLDTSIAAAIYGIILLFLLINIRKIKLAKYLKLALIAVYSLLGLLTYSRGFYLAILLTLIIYLVSLRKYLYIVFLLLTFFCLLFFLPKKFGEGVNLLRTFSITSRIQENKGAIIIWQKKPILGIGYNRIRYEKERTGFLRGEDIDTNHSAASFPSSFLIILTTGGIIGSLSLVWVLLDLARISQTALLLIIFTAIFSLYDNVLLHPFILFLLFAILSIERRIFNYRRSNSP